MPYGYDEDTNIARRRVGVEAEGGVGGTLGISPPVGRPAPYPF